MVMAGVSNEYHNMAILNYTTKIDADKTAMEISKCLSMHGAKSVNTEYDTKQGCISAISFMILLKDQPICFKLPCHWEPILQLISDDRKVPNRLKTREQAVRIAWRIVKDWVEAQMALVETKMAKTEEVFLPYALNSNGETLFQQIEKKPELLLGNAPSQA